MTGRRENWRTRQYRFQVREIEELRQGLQESKALTEHQAALAVAALADQLGNGTFDLEDLDATELDALACMIQAHLEDRARRARPSEETEDLAERFPGEHHVAALYRGIGAGDY